MRKAGFLFTLIIVAIYAKGQEDTLRIKTKQPLRPDQSELYKLRKDKNHIFREPDGYTDIYNKNLVPDMDQLFPMYPHRKKKSFFNASYSKFIVPTALISYGLIAQDNEKLEELDKSTHHEITEHYDGVFPVDDYLQYIPYAAYYALDLFGVEAKHNIRDRTIILLTSYVVMSITVQGMKNGFGVERPDGSSKTSFPSGHTATAFLGAHLLFKEYKDTSPWIGITGYLSATTVGCLRVRNQKHWVSDVVTGAGIGMISAEVGNLLLPVFHNIFGIKDNNKHIVIAPVIDANSYGIGFACTF